MIFYISTLVVLQADEFLKIEIDASNLLQKAFAKHIVFYLCIFT